MLSIHVKHSARRGICALVAIAGFSLAACGGGKPASTTPAVSPAPAAAVTPAVLKIYEQTCHNCHAVPASGAPQIGDAKAWAPRLAQGRETLLNHSINGFKGMPPMGTCTQCTEQDFASLIEYMSGAQLK
jgi:cytochrome c5